MTTCTATTRLTLSPFDQNRPDVQCHRDVDTDGRHVGEHQGTTVTPKHPGDPTADYPWLRETRPAYTSLVTWSDGGAQSCHYDPEQPNQNCMCVGAANRGDDRTLARLGHRPEDHRWATCDACGVITDTVAPAHLNVWCRSCGLWNERAQDYAVDRRTPVPRMPGRWTRGVRPHPGGPMADNRLYGWSHGHGGAFGGRRFVVTWDDGDTAGPADYLWDGGAIPWWLDHLFPPNATVTTDHGTERRPGHTTGFNGHGQPLTYTGHPEVPR